MYIYICIYTYIYIVYIYIYIYIYIYLFGGLRGPTPRRRRARGALDSSPWTGAPRSPWAGAPRKAHMLNNTIHRP